MRENPWISRFPTVTQHEHFERLRTLHALTQSLCKTAGLSYSMWIELLRNTQFSRPSDIELQNEFLGDTEENSLLIPKKDKSLADEMDETQPDDVLYRTERFLWSSLAKTSSLLKSIHPSETFFNQMKKKAFEAGQQSATTLKLTDPITDCREICTLLLAAPLLLTPFSKGLFIERTTESHLCVKLLGVPSLSPYPEVRDLSPSLTPLYQEWIRGYLTKLSKNVHCEFLEKNNSIRLLLSTSPYES